ncbi:fibronectin type III domain-containing protein, partial [Lutimonas saemankumensis]|uniref:fibronectin type III domain-containing protein n=1 Tax=Lutimonas saemankumensis TaxID=483016 RepID=UPI001CD75D22
LQIRNQSTGDELSSLSYDGYTNLINRGWTIDVDAPEPPVSGVPVMGVLLPPTNVSTTSLTLDWTAGTDDVGVTGYNVYKDDVLEASLGNVLTYDVTGLTPGTNYDFYVTALNALENESSPSNTQNVSTTLPASTITIMTTSTSSTWSPNRVTNSGSTLRWIANGGGITEQIIDANDPVFDLSGNTGTVTVTVESSDGFTGLTQLWLDYLTISMYDVSNAVNLQSLSSRGNRNLGTVDLSSLSSLLSFRSDVTDLTSIDFSANDLL